MVETSNVTSPNEDKNVLESHQMKRKKISIEINNDSSQLPTLKSSKNKEKTKTMQGSDVKMVESKQEEIKQNLKSNNYLMIANVDDLRNYAYEGGASTSESLSSCCSSKIPSLLNT